ncbi:MAG: hypothetical protein KAT05_14735 [Spirochaetes bacterium]|nr:hypothetical protein [Spirochaetota bacterium]
MNFSKTFNQTILDLKKMEYYLLLSLFSIIGFCIPFLIGKPQLFVGCIINALLTLSALCFKKNAQIPLILLPSLGALTRGMLFGPLTIFLVYFIPFIWIGNFIFIWLIKELHITKNINYILSLLIAAIGKALFLGLIAIILINFKIVPKPFLTIMSLTQLITAIIGGMIAYCYIFIREKIRT